MVTMSKKLLLKEYLKLVLETGKSVQPRTDPFYIDGFVTPHKHIRDEITITRDFPLVMLPDMMQMMKINDDDLENGALTGDHEIVIQPVEGGFRPGPDYRGIRGSLSTRINPPDYGEVEWGGEYEVISVDGFDLGAEDATRMRAYLGDLTDDEMADVDRWFINNYEREKSDFDY